MAVTVQRFRTCNCGRGLTTNKTKRSERFRLNRIFSTVVVKAKGDSKDVITGQQIDSADTKKDKKTTKKDVVTGDPVDAPEPKRKKSSKESGKSKDSKDQKAGRIRRTRLFIKSDGSEHLGSAVKASSKKFPGPPPDQGPRLRVLPIGGLGEIGMNCMLVGVGKRYILIDAGLMFPDFTDYGMQKILPDTTFLARWKDRIEALIITHGHEDHIGAIPWVVPALDRRTKIYASSFVMQLVKRRLQEFNIYDPDQCKVFKMRERFKAGPFEIEPIRVTHSIPDCCGMILRSEAGNIVHTGDFKIDEEPLDDIGFDREALEQIGKEGVSLFMSDSTNALAMGRTVSEATVRKNIIERVMSHKNGRVIATQFASNLHRLGSMKAAAEASNRKICFIGTALHVYLEAAYKDNRAPFDPKQLIQATDLENYKPSEVLVVTTGSQAEERAALQLASIDQSTKLKLYDSDLLLYSAKVIPGNDVKVMQMMNRISRKGPQIAMGRGELLHSSGHAYREELSEVLKLVKPQHFLPVHGEYAFLRAHAELALDLGIKNVQVIRNGEMLGVNTLRNNNQYSSISGMQKLGEAQLQFLYNDGARGTGNRLEMNINERQKLANEGLVVIAIDLKRQLLKGSNQKGKGRQWIGQYKDMFGSGSLDCDARITTRGMWTDDGTLHKNILSVTKNTVSSLSADSDLIKVEQRVVKAVSAACYKFNEKSPEIMVIAHENDPRAATLLQKINESTPQQEVVTSKKGRSRKRSKGHEAHDETKVDGYKLPDDVSILSSEELDEIKQASPRQKPEEYDDQYDMTYG